MPCSHSARRYNFLHTLGGLSSLRIALVYSALFEIVVILNILYFTGSFPNSQGNLSDTSHLQLSRFRLGGSSMPFETGVTDSILSETGSTKRQEKACALLFFGIGRNFKDIAFPSIQQHILDANPSCDIFVHTYNDTEAQGSRKNMGGEGENTDSIYASEMLLLTDRSKIMFETEKEFRHQRDLDFYRALFPMPSSWDYPLSMDNMIRQWHSINQVWTIMESHEQLQRKRYYRVGLFRPDVYYTHDIRIDDVNETAVIPSMMYEPTLWRGYNDRMFYGDRSYAQVWATDRFDSVVPYLRWQKENTDTTVKAGLHSEDFMRYLLTIRWPMPLAIKDICFQRIRASGIILTRDCKLLNIDDIEQKNVTPEYESQIKLVQAGGGMAAIESMAKERLGLSNRRTCLSPEKKVPWILNGDCLDHPPVSFSSNQGRTCGLCREGAAYIRELRDEISSQFVQKCKDKIIVYGAALGWKYEEWMQDPDFLGGHGQKVVQMYGNETCFFQFVTDLAESNKTMSIDGVHNLITVDLDQLPYENNRRNTKMLKLNPGLLFPWAQKIIWQDVKLFRSVGQDWSSNFPTDYSKHFDRTVGYHKTCAGFTGLPFHKNSIFKHSTKVTLESHCEAIVEASKLRPTVSDDLQGLIAQCQLYEEMYKGTDDKSRLFHQDPLVDSAFIVWDMQSEACRTFNANLGCSWLDEIHCYSDRDQVSFPLVLASSGLKIPSDQPKRPTDVIRDRVYVNDDNIPMLHITRRSCHWYFQSFSRCVASHERELENDLSIERVEKRSRASPNGTDIEQTRERYEDHKGVRVAIIVAGTLQRNLFSSTMRSVIKPLVQNDDVYVDYYGSLTTAPAKAYRPGGYMEYAEPDPFFEGRSDPIIIENLIRRGIGTVRGASVGDLIIQESINIDLDSQLKAKREKSLQEYPGEDPDLRFPIIDVRTAEIGNRTANANRNLLRMHRAIQSLWQSATKWEQEEGFEYDFVLFLRDDALWLDDLTLWPFIWPKAEVFVPSCDDREIPMDNNEINDHIVISRRSTADIFGSYYSRLFEVDLKACASRLPSKIVQNGLRGCNSEMLLKWVMDEEEIDVKKVPQIVVPFQRSMNFKLPDGSYAQCFHKFCQSKSDPLELEEGETDLGMCKNVNWHSLFPSTRDESSEE